MYKYMSELVLIMYFSSIYHCVMPNGHATLNICMTIYNIIVMSKKCKKIT